jgi:hypothetical protein
MATYAETVSAIESTTENTYDTVDVDRFITNAEERIFNMVRLPFLRKTDTSITTVNGTSTITLPTDFLAPFSVAIVSSGTYTYLLNKDPDFIREAYPVIATTGVPAHYAFVNDTTLIMGPTPGAAYSVVLNYFYMPSSLTVDTSGTWLSDNFFSALLAACLVEAAIFMKSTEDIVALYDKDFKQKMTLLLNLGSGRLQQDDYRSGSARTKVV